TVLLVGSLIGDLAVVEPLKIYYRTHYAQAFTIPSGAMQPTLLVGDYILVDKSAYRVGAPQRSDIVVFLYPQNEKRDFIQRIVGTPGETVHVKGRQIFINGELIPEPYVRPTDGAPPPGAQPAFCGSAYGCEPAMIPADSYFVMGDNRDNSQDSRYWGFVRREKIKGKAFLIYWSWNGESHWPRWSRIGMYLP